MASLGKQFESKFKEDWKKSFPNTFIYRLPDQLSEYKNSRNPCDFICYNNRNLYLIETKVHEGNTIPFSAISQHELLMTYTNMDNVYPLVIIWFRDHNKVVGINTLDMDRMIRDNYKSINITKTNDIKKYNIFEIPSTMKRTFMDSNYSNIDTLVKKRDII